MATKSRPRRRETAPAPAPLPRMGGKRGTQPLSRPRSARGPRPLMADRGRLAALLAALAALVLVVFARVVGQDFVLWDDTIEIYKNPYFSPVTGDHLAYLWQHAYLNLYIPLSSTAFALLALLGHLDVTDPALTRTGATLNPHVFHAFSLAVHMVNVLLVFAILRFLVRRDLPAAVGAALFAVHPVQAESVAWASELRGLLCGFFSLLCIALYLAFARATQARRTADQAWPWYAAALICAVLALLCKPSAVSLPLILFALDRWCIGRPWRRSALSAAPLLLGSLIFILVTSSAQPVEAGIITPLWQRPFVAGDALAFYLATFFAPLNLGIDYGRTPHEVLGHWWGYCTWLAPAAVAVGVWLVRRSAPWAVASALVSVAALLPVLGLLPFAFQHYSTVADRYLYLALLGPALALAYALTWAEAGLRAARLRAVAGLAGVISVVLAALAFVQGGYWADSPTLLRHAVAVDSRSDVSYGNLGIDLAQHGRLVAAAADLRRALALNPDNYQAHSNLGNVFLLQRQYARAIAEYRASIRINPTWDESRTNLGIALSIRGDLQDAVAQFREAVRLNPFSQSAQDGLQRDLTLLAQQKRPKT